MKNEFGRWRETAWTSETIDWRGAGEVRAGVDVGTTSAQAAILCDGELFGYASLRVGADFAQAAEQALAGALGGSGMARGDIARVAATGFGRRNAAFADAMADEVHCHAKGARFLFGPQVHTVVDMGGQTCEAIRLYDWDRVRDFMVSDKCATGFGRSMERMCGLLQVPIERIGELSLDVPAEPEPVSTTCGTFSGTETMGLFRPDFKAEKLCENEIYASYLFAVSWRILGLVQRLQPLDVGEIGLAYPAVGFTGGLAKNPGVTKRLERELGVTALESRYDPQLAGAIGAALLA